MPKVGKLGDKINAYIHVRNEHYRPHFHIRGPGWSVSIAIGSWELLEGQPPQGKLADILRWARDHEQMLSEKWSEFNEQQD
jgi:Domain of unknown function (DUF4160)